MPVISFSHVRTYMLALLHSTSFSFHIYAKFTFVISSAHVRFYMLPLLYFTLLFSHIYAKSIMIISFSHVRTYMPPLLDSSFSPHIYSFITNLQSASRISTVQ